MDFGINAQEYEYYNHIINAMAAQQANGSPIQKLQLFAANDNGFKGSLRDFSSTDDFQNDLETFLLHFYSEEEAKVTG